MGTGPHDGRVCKFVFVGHGDRPGHGEYAGLRQGPGRNPVGTLGRGLSRQGRRQEGAGRGRGCQADARPHSGKYRGHPPHARRRDRRFRHRRGDDQALHPQGAQTVDLLEAQDHRLRAARRHPGGKASHPPIGAVRRRPPRRADRRTDCRGHRVGHADHRPDRQHGRRYRRRDNRSCRVVAG